MSNQATVQSRVYGFSSVFKKEGSELDHDKPEETPTQEISFNTEDNLRLVVSGGRVGPEGISETTADLVDFAVTVFQIEKILKGRQRTNPATKFELSMQLRRPEKWTGDVVVIVKEILLLLGNAEWCLDFRGGLTAPIPDHKKVKENSGVDQIVLFSGGMDSTCGLATLQADKDRTRLVSFYTRQKRLQREIARDLGFLPPVQWGRIWESDAGPGRGHTFYYRSFLFLCLAAATASSWNAHKILQFENGILASAIPPAPSWMMTKHAHPKLHELASELFSKLLGGEWTIENPFHLLTKRDCFQKAIEGIGRDNAEKLAEKCETCWFQVSNRIIKPANEEIPYKGKTYKGKEAWEKKPGTPCGICIPCIIRRTAFQKDINQYKWDLTEDSVRNDPTLGAAFRSYFLLLKQVDAAHNANEFYQLLSASGRNLVATGEYKLQELYNLFSRFSDEFMEAYDLEGYEL